MNIIAKLMPKSEKKVFRLHLKCQNEQGII